jgi:hypothetical protein
LVRKDCVTVKCNEDGKVRVKGRQALPYQKARRHDRVEGKQGMPAK